MVRRVNESSHALNALNGSSKAPWASFAPRDVVASGPQRDILQRLHRRVGRHGSRPPIAAQQAYLDLIKSKDLYSSEGASLVPYDSSKLAVLRGSVDPRPLRPRLPPEARHLLDNKRRTIFRASADIDRLVDAGEIPQIQPFWDASLRFSATKRRDFIRALHRCGLVSFRLRIAYRVGCFFVAKKNGDIRLVIDGREPSAFHQRPPHVELGSAGAISFLDLSDDAFVCDGVDPSTLDLSISGVDLKDGFYQFVDQDLASNFGFDFPEEAHWYGCTHVYDDTSRAFETVERLACTPCSAGFRWAGPGACTSASRCSAAPCQMPSGRTVDHVSFEKGVRSQGSL